MLRRAQMILQVTFEQRKFRKPSLWVTSIYFQLMINSRFCHLLHG